MPVGCYQEGTEKCRPSQPVPRLGLLSRNRRGLVSDPTREPMMATASPRVSPKTFLVDVGTVETGHSIAPQFVVTPKSVRWIQIRQVNLNDTQPMRILGWYENVRRAVQHAGAGRLDRFNRAGA